MTIAIDARIIYTSTGRYVERLLTYLQQIDTTNTYIVLLLAKDFPTWQPTSPNFQSVVADFAPYTFAEQLGFYKLLRSLRVDLVHFTMPQQPLLYRHPHITTIHDLTLVDFINPREEGSLKNIYRHHIKPAVFRQVMKQVIASSAAIITPTRFVQQQILNRYRVDPAKVTVTLEAADLFPGQPEEVAFLRSKPFLMYLGNAYPYKNLERLIRAFVKVQTSRPDLYLVLAGKPEYFYHELQRLVEREKIQNVYFAGFVPDSQAAWLYQQAQIYIFPSLAEGFGLPALEAMTQGTPVLASRASCLPEVCGSAADFFDPFNVADIAEAVNNLLANPARQNQLHELGPKHAATFSWERMARQTLSIYEAVVKK